MTQEIKAGWRERWEDMKDRSPIRVTTTLSPHLAYMLTPEERERLDHKLTLVSHEASKMALGMLKGTVKYTREAITASELKQHIDEERVDKHNYELILEDVQND